MRKTGLGSRSKAYKSVSLEKTDIILNNVRDLLDLIPNWNGVIESKRDKAVFPFLSCIQNASAKLLASIQLGYDRFKSKFEYKWLQGIRKMRKWSTLN